MITKDFPFKSICIFGCGRLGKLFHDWIKRINAEVICIFCDSNYDKHKESSYEVVSPSVAVEQFKSSQLDAIIIPGAYPAGWQTEMMVLLAFHGMNSEGIYIIDQSFFLSIIDDNNNYFKKLSDVCIADLPGYGSEFGLVRMGQLYDLARRIHSVINSLIVRHNIDGKQRILVYHPQVTINPNCGDIWYFLSRVPIYESTNSCRLVLLIDNDNAETIQQKSRFLEYDGYSFEFATADTSEISTIDIFGKFGDYDWMKLICTAQNFYSLFKSERFRVYHFSDSSNFTKYFINLIIKPEAPEIRRPRFRHFDRQHYIDAYSISPGRTFWIIPDSNFVKPFPLSYWNSVAAILKNLGYTVVFNSKNPECNGTLAFIPWDDVVGFAELCGHVIGTRTGFFDFAIIAKANFYIFTPPAYMNVLVETAFNVDNSDGHIRTIPIKGIRNYDNLPEFTYFDSIKKNFVEFVYNLSCEKDRYIIFMATKYSHCPPPSHEKNKKLGILSLLGLTFDFNASFGWSYCAVIDGGKVITEEFSLDECVMFEYIFDNDRHNAKITSQGCNFSKDSCIASIMVDGIQTCLNRRGLNFVIWDKQKDEAAEYAVFDTFNTLSLYDSDTLDYLTIDK